MSEHTKGELEMFFQDGKLYLECDAPQGKVRLAEMTMGHRTDTVQDADHFLKCWNSHEAQLKRIEELEAEVEQNRWIPVSERLPEDTDRLLAYGKDGYGYKIVAATTYDLRFKKFRILQDVTHWKPIVLPAQALQGKPSREESKGE